MTTTIGFSLLLTGAYTGNMDLVIVGSVLIPSPCLAWALALVFSIASCILVVGSNCVVVCLIFTIDEVETMLTCPCIKYYNKLKDAYYYTPPVANPSTPFKSTDNDTQSTLV